MLVDDRSSVVSLPELPLLAALPGTGGLTRFTDKRHVRRDPADCFATEAISNRWVTAPLNHSAGTAELTVSGPDADAPADVSGTHALGADFWPLAMTRELDDLIPDLRTNEPELGTWVLRTNGDPRRPASSSTARSKQAARCAGAAGRATAFPP
jgi:hypothetical protein